MADYRTTYRPQHRRPGGILGRGREGRRLWRTTADEGAGRQPCAVLPLVPRRRAQHLLQRARPARGGRPRRPARPDLRQPGHRHAAHLHLRRSCSRRSPASPARSRSLGVEQGRPGRHLPADGPRGRGRDAGLRAARRGALGGVRRLRGRTSSRPASTTRSPRSSSRRPAASRPSRVIEYKPLLDRALELADAPARARASCCSGRRPSRRRWPRRATIDWDELVADGASPRSACRCRDRPALRALHVRHDRQAQGRRPRQRRPRRRAALVDGQHLRHRPRATCGGPPPTSAGWSATPTSSTRRCSSARRPCSTRASRSARRTPAPSGGSSPSTGSQALFTAPTAIRAIKKEDPDGEAAGGVRRQSSLRTLFLAGERLDPDT